MLFEESRGQSPLVRAWAEMLGTELTSMRRIQARRSQWSVSTSSIPKTASSHSEVRSFPFHPLIGPDTCVQVIRSTSGRSRRIRRT